MINKLKPKSDFSRNVFTLMTGTVIAQVIPIAISPILTRIYTPEDFGVFALFISIVGMMAMIVSGKYELAILLPRYEKDAFNLFMLAVFIVFIMFILYVIGVTIGYFLYSFSLLYFLLPFAVVFMGLNTIFDKFNNRIKNYKLMSYQRLIKSTIESIVSLGFMFFLHSHLGSVWGFVLGYLVSTTTMMIINYYRFKENSLSYSFLKMKVLSKKYQNFPKFNMPHALLNTFSTNIPIFLVPFLFENAILGFYAFGLKIVQAPFALLSMALFNVLSQKMAYEFQEKRSIKLLFINMLKKLSFIALSTLPLFLFAPDIFAFVFGKEWVEAGEYIQVLAPYILLSFIASPFAGIPLLYNAQKKAFILELIHTVLKLLPFVVFGFFLEYSFKEILYIYSTVTSLFLIYSFYWCFSLIEQGEEPIHVQL